MRGGDGADVFVFGRADDTNRIHDFQNGSNLIEITGGAERFADLRVDDVVIGYADTRIVLEDEFYSGICASDFIFD
jgi:hypothetical protein